MGHENVLFSFPSWVLLIIIGLLTIYLVSCLLPRAKIDIQGKYVLITGCDSGFGRATAIQLDKMGVCVLATCLTKDGEQSLKSVTSDQLKTFQMDVTNSQQIKDVYEEIRKEVSAAGLWGLVNNAGILYLSPIEWTPLDVFKRTADVNLWGMIDVTKTFLPLVKKSKGRVVNLSSMNGRVSPNCYASYSVSKYGVEAFSDALRREMHPWGIKVSMLEPGCFTTNISAPDVLERQLWNSWDKLSQELKNDYGEGYLKRVIDIVKGIHRNTDISQVVNAIVDGLSSASPPDRYVIGRDARFGLLQLSYLPGSLADFVIRVAYNVPLPQGCLN